MLFQNNALNFNSLNSITKIKLRKSKALKLNKIKEKLKIHIVQIPVLQYTVQ